MMSETVFMVMISVFWLSEIIFGSLVVYWFVVQGLDEDSTTDSDIRPLESRSETLQSLGLWAAFFGVLVVGILLAS